MFKKKIKIGKNMISDNSPVFIIAEIGFNFNGNLKLAEEMIIAAKESGADAVKFQSFRAESLVLETEPAYKIIKANELSKEAHYQLSEFCNNNNITFLSTPFSPDLLDFLVDEIKVPAVKIASGDLNYYPLIKRAAEKNLPVILSTGMAAYNEIDETVDLIKNRGNDKLILLHCISNYPLEPENANLEVIPELKKRYGCLTGFSDHSEGLLMSVIAVSLGAKLIEKHFTTDKKLPDADNAISTEPKEFKEMVEQIREAEKALGDKQNKPSKSEAEIRKSARRNIYAARDIKKGKQLEPDDIKIVRPKSNGLPPSEFNKIINTKVKQSYNKNDLLEENGN